MRQRVTVRNLSIAAKNETKSPLVESVKYASPPSCVWPACVAVSAIRNGGCGGEGSENEHCHHRAKR